MCAHVNGRVRVIVYTIVEQISHVILLLKQRNERINTIFQSHQIGYASFAIRRNVFENNKNPLELTHHIYGIRLIYNNMRRQIQHGNTIRSTCT